MGTDGEHVFGHVYDTHPESEQRQMELNNLGRNQHDLALEPEEPLVSNGSLTRETEEHRSRSCLPFSLQFKLQYLPVVTFIFILSALIICFTVAAALGHVEPIFPYISHTAIEAPERCIFSQTVNIGAVLLAANVYVRYQQMIVYLTMIHASAARRCINTVSLVLGFTSAFGLSVVANFQTNEMQIVHYIGAFLAFTFGVAYCWLQTAISFRYCKRKFVTVCQFVISILLTICYIVFFISKVVFRFKEYAGHGTKYGSLRFVYLVSTISEWLTAVFIIAFLLTFYKDFSNCCLECLKVKVKNQDLARQQYHSSIRRNQANNV